MYKKFLIQQIRYDGATYEWQGDPVDTQTAYNVVCKEAPFKYNPETREPAKRVWNDGHGEDVYIPARGIRLEAYDLEVKFLYSYGDYSAYVYSEALPTYQDWLADKMHKDLCAFTDYITCKKDEEGNIREDNLSGTMLAIYDEYTGNGIVGVYVKEISSDAYVYNEVSEKAVAEFSVTFRVTDPITHLDEKLIENG